MGIPYPTVARFARYAEECTSAQRDWVRADENSANSQQSMLPLSVLPWALRPWCPACPAIRKTRVGKPPVAPAAKTGSEPGFPVSGSSQLALATWP